MKKQWMKCTKNRKLTLVWLIVNSLVLTVNSCGIMGVW